ncbi:MAG: AAA family ATPase [Candidatus Kapaibacterium sp.]
MEQEVFFSERTHLGDLTKGVEEIRKEIGKIIVGQHEMIDLLIAAMLADGHVLIEGVPGVAKTLTAKLLARTLDIPYSRIQFTPDLMPSDILGTSVFNIKTNDFEYHEGPIFANLVLIDEVNRAPAKTQSALFEVMEERQITTEGKTRQMSLPFLVVATQNPIEQEGTYRLPEAQLDRFLFKIDVGYPTLEEETRIIREYHERGDVNDLSIVQPVIDASKIRALQETARRIRIDDNLVRYIAEIIARTRDNTALYLGASPRASLAVMSGAKGIAAMRGRDFVTPEDIKFVLIPTLRHRILLTPEKEMEGSRAEDVINLIVEGVEVPR